MTLTSKYFPLQESALHNYPYPRQSQLHLNNFPPLRPANSCRRWWKKRLSKGKTRTRGFKRERNYQKFSGILPEILKWCPSQNQTTFLVNYFINNSLILKTKYETHRWTSCQFRLKCFLLHFIQNLPREEQVIIKINLTKKVISKNQTALLLFHNVDKVPEQSSWHFE